MKKFALAVICTMTAVGFVMAEEFTLSITKISDDGTSVTGTKAAKKGKAGGGGGKGEEVTVKVASGVQVFKGKFDTESKSFVKDGDDLKLAGLKKSLTDHENGTVTVAGTALTDKDSLVLTIKDGKPAGKLNGKDIDMTELKVTGKTALSARVTTNDDGAISTFVLVGGFGGGGKKKAQ